MSTQESLVAIPEGNLSFPPRPRGFYKGTGDSARLSVDKSRRVSCRRLLLPTTAKRAVKLHQGERLALLRAGKVELRGKQVGVGG